MRFAALGLFLLLLVASSPPQGREGNGVAEQPAANQTKAQPHPPPRPVRQLPSARENQERCEDTEAKNGPDICAQWAAADAAQSAADAGWWTLYVSGFGLVALIFTLLATAWAAWAATRAAVAADKAVEITADTAKRQLRAYVMAEDQAVTGIFRGGPAACAVKVYNRGQTPAHDVRVWSIVTGTQTDPDRVKIFKKAGEEFHEARNVIGPDNFLVHTNNCQAPLGDPAYAAIVTGNTKLVFAGVITYVDSFGRRRFTTFKQFYVGDGNWATVGGDMSSCGRGNIAS